MEGEYKQSSALTSLYIQCKNFIIHVSILYKRGNFLWIGSDNLQLEQKKLFGDVSRSINKSESRPQFNLV